MFDIHKILWDTKDPVDVINDPQHGTNPQAICLSNVWMQIWKDISINT